MPNYIVCHQKRNTPRIDVRICEKKCPEKDDCKAFLDFQRLSLQNPSPRSDSPGVELEAA